MTTSTITPSTDAPVTVTKTGRLWTVAVDGTDTATFRTKAEAMAEAEAEVAAWIAEHTEYVVNARQERVDALVETIEAAIEAQAPQTTEATEAPAVDLTADAIAGMDVVVRLTVAKHENLAVRAWKAAGCEGPRPATPVMDWMANPTKPRRDRRSTGTPRQVGHGTFTVADGMATYTCAVCGTTKPVTAFPTVKGPALRGCRCRACRDAK